MGQMSYVTLSQNHEKIGVIYLVNDLPHHTDDTRIDFQMPIVFVTTNKFTSLNIHNCSQNRPIAGRHLIGSGSSCELLITRYSSGYYELTTQ